MRIIEQRILRGPNIWASIPCLQTLVEVNERALTLSPALAALLPAGMALNRPQAAARLALALQRLAGFALDFSVVAPGQPGQARIVFAYELEQLACKAMQLALDLLECESGQDKLLTERLPALRDTVRSHELDGVARATIAAAQARDIPVMRSAHEARVFQLGWGKHQIVRDGSTRQPKEPGLQHGTGRIPVIAVTGTNGKTTTTLMIGHCVRRAGLAPGVTTTEGVYIDGARIAEGDCAGFHSARTVLASRAVDIAVLETARGGILKRGLAFDKCSVGVVLNVAADHLGLDGVETVEQLALVKGLIARNASQAAVLNADDPHCVAMAATLRAGAQAIYFSMEAANPVLLRHLAGGGRATYLDDGGLMIAHGTRRDCLMRAIDLPCSLNGHARYNVANALAAAAALTGAGLRQTAIADGLSTFVSDARSNPLRTNVYDIDDVTVIVDYAHNPAAYAALSAMARSLCKGKRRAVVTAPGDRRDSDLLELGRTCAAGFDELFVYEADPRGRATGETAERILEGARGAGMGMQHTHALIPVAGAFGAAIAASRPGDILIFACGSATTASAIVQLYLKPRCETRMIVHAPTLTTVSNFPIRASAH